MTEFTGLTLGNLPILSDAETRSISAENPTGEKGKGGMATTGTGANAARDLGQGWKVSPSVEIDPESTFVLADIEGPGVIQSMWISGYVGRDFILRIYWNAHAAPSVEVPLPDFFALPWVGHMVEHTSGPIVTFNSLPVCVNPNRGLSCFWPMPFSKRCRITLENRNPELSKTCFYQICYELTSVPDTAGYFHAQFRHTNPLPYSEVYTIVDGIKGKGHYVGTSMGWGINNNGWWGEGEIKFYIDGDEEFPTICGTGVEDYFGGAYCWEVDGEYVEYNTPFLGMHQVIRPDGLYNSQHRHSMYRWHIMDPIRFKQDLGVTIQALGWHPDEGQKKGPRYLPGRHRISSVAFWFQTLPSQTFPELPDRDDLVVD